MDSRIYKIEEGLYDDFIKNDTENSKSTPSSDEDYHREEELWNRNSELLIEEWLDEIYSQREKLKIAGYYFNNLKKVFSLPTLIIPAILAPLNATFASNPDIHYVNTFGFVLVGLFSVLVQYNDYDKRELHAFEYVSKYAELYTDIRSELVKKKRFRQQLDVFTARIMSKLDSLNASCPMIPKDIEVKKITLKRRLSTISSTLS